MEPERPMLFIQRASGTLLKPNIKDAAVSVVEDAHESVTYTMADPRSRKKAAAVSSRRPLMSS